MISELRKGLVVWREEVEHVFGRLEYSSDEGDDGGVYQNILNYHEKYVIFRIYLNVISRGDIDLNNRVDVLDALRADRKQMQDFVDDTVKNEYPPHEVKCAKYALRHYDELIRKIETT